MSRSPTRRTRLSRRGRLLRSSAILAGFIVVVALIVGKLGGGEKEEPTPIVSFLVGSIRSNAEGARPPASGVNGERDAIKKVIDDWFQTAFVDPKKYGDGTFESVAEHFAKDARAAFKADLNTLTIGEARVEVERVRPITNRFSLALYWADGKPTHALARVLFSADASMKEEAARPLRIVFTGDVTLEKQSGDWVVTYYKANQTQKSIEPTPTPTT